MAFRITTKSSCCSVTGVALHHRVTLTSEESASVASLQRAYAHLFLLKRFFFCKCYNKEVRSCVQKNSNFVQLNRHHNRDRLLQTVAMIVSSVVATGVVIVAVVVVGDEMAA